jgi:splicing factor U2AF subunit
MVSIEELSSQEDYRDICLDVQEEAGKHGEVVVSIPRPPTPGAGRVFLQYENQQTATAAAQSFAGRKFGPNVIVARYYEEGAFGAGQLTA